MVGKNFSIIAAELSLGYLLVVSVRKSEEEMLILLIVLDGRRGKWSTYIHSYVRHGVFLRSGS